ncbi:NnrU family protein [Phenylobacterium sp.]|uniref:NnrU family protein n=1 Tax=Phenylobacterium sp. TaxID=1871053 RepID=UPI0019B36416|nr:NnrU family protein [Phenylobacterium sp.]MBC7168547.1 NnrU family protein [Phenylobacterium sp.]
MTNLIAAAAVFVLIHLLISGTRVRDALVARLGEGAYMGLFSLASVAALAWLGFAYAGARDDAWNLAYWGVTPAGRHLQLSLQVIAFLFIVLGLATPNPTSVKQEGVLDRDDAVKGILRVTRHPFLWGVAIWAAGHLIVNGDRASLILFGSLLVLAVFGTASIDAKRRRALGDRWSGFAARTSNIPFAAVLTGRQKLSLSEIGVIKPAIALGVYAALLFAHPYLFGVPALP